MEKDIKYSYFLSRPVEEEGKPTKKCRRRMHNIWKD